MPARDADRPAPMRTTTPAKPMAIPITCLARMRKAPNAAANATVIPGHRKIMRLASAAGIRRQASRKNTVEPDSPHANAIAGSHVRQFEAERPALSAKALIVAVIAQAIMKMKVMHSKAGSVRVCNDKAGHVAQSAIATPPSKVHQFFDRSGTPIRERLLRSTNVRVMGSGQGSVASQPMIAELPNLIKEILSRRIPVEVVRVALADVERACNSPVAAGQRVVLIP
jgi:hypothetical protein